MDGRGRFIQWSASIAATFLLLAVPIAYWLYTVQRHLSKNDVETLAVHEKYAALYPEATRIGKQARKPDLVSIRPTVWPGSGNKDLDDFQTSLELVEYEITSEEARNRIETLFQRKTRELLVLSNSDEQLYSRTNAQPITLEPHTRQALLANATYVRLSFLNQPKQQSQIELLDEQVTLFTQLTKQLRLSPNWKDQETADAFEIWLLQTLAAKEVQPLLKRPSFGVAIKLIADQPGRIQARRRAVMASWYLMSQPGNRVYAGGSIHWMLDMLEAVEKDRDIRPILSKIHRFNTPSNIAFEDGPYSDRVRVGANDPHTIFDEFSLPASQWFADWEQDAVRLWQSQNADSAEASK